jgi:hypothetical protein
MMTAHDAILVALFVAIVNMILIGVVWVITESESQQSVVAPFTVHLTAHYLISP